ncbi:MAG: hypothetical protein KA369_11240 [Spirochaetes bacterium]|nr:hypothetical protein [Spirochaetota bacterium]
MDNKEKHEDLLADFYRMLLEAERAGVKSLNEIMPLIEDGDLKSQLLIYLRDEGMNCQILTNLIKNLGQDPGERTGDFIDKIRALDSTDEKLKLLIKGQEWVAKQIRYNRELINSASSMLFVEAIKIQHEKNVDIMKQLLQIKSQ